MYPVSTKFQEAIKKTYREERVQGLLWLFDSNEQFDTGYQFTEDAIVQGSLTITDQLTNGKFGYGGTYIRNLKIKLDTDKINNLNPININLTNARIFIWYYLTLDDGTEESVPLWLFYINAKESSRKSNILSIVAEDAMTKFDVMSVGMSDVTPYEIYSKACSLAGVGEATTESEFADFPNGDMYVSFDTTQIETARDMLMWVAKLTGTIARVKMGGADNNNDVVELVQIPTKYTRGGTSGNFNLDAFKADNGTIIPPDIRFQTNFTDTSIRITTIIMNRRDENVVYHNNWTFAPDTLEGTIEIENNPLLKNADSYTANNAVKNLAQYTDDLRFCPSTVSFNGNPAIQIGDFVFLEKGGGIDDTKYRHYMIVTYSKWVYGGKHEIRCATDAAAERPKPSEPSTQSTANEPIALAANARISALAATEEIRPIVPKSQTEKMIRGASGGYPDRLVSNNVVARLSGYGNGRLDFRDENASYPQNYLGEITFSHYTNPELYIRTGAGDRPNKTEIRIEDSLRVLCQKGTIQYGDNDATVINGSPDQGRICLNANDNNDNYPPMLVLNTPKGYKYSIKFSPSGVTFSNGVGGSFTIPFTTEATEEEEQK